MIKRYWNSENLKVEFSKKIEKFIFRKKNSRLKILGEDQNNNLEKNIFTNN